MTQHLIYIMGASAIAFGFYLAADLTITRGVGLRAWQRGLLLTTAFSLMLSGCIGYGHELRPGVFIDARGAVLALATLVGGFRVGAATMVVGLGVRWLKGGAGMEAGLASVALEFLAAAAVIWLWQRRFGVWRGQWLLLLFAGAATGAVDALSLRWIGTAEEGAALLRMAGLDLFVTQTACTLLLGGVIHLQRERRRSNELYQTALTTSMDGFARLSEDGCLREVNPELAAILRYSCEALQTLTLAQLVVAEGTADPLAWLAEVRAKQRWRGESVWRRKDGTKVTLQVTATAAPPTVGGVYAFLHDLTDEKAHQSLLANSENRLRRLIEGLPDVVYTYSTTRGGVFYSPRVEAVLGYTPEYLYARPLLWAESIHPEDQPQVRRAVAAFGRGVPFEMEYRIRDQHGAWRWIRDRSIRRTVLDDEVLIDGLATDMTALRERELEVRRIYNQVPDMICECDLTGRFTKVNAAWEATLGYPPGELLGHSFSEFAHPDDLATTQAEVARQLAGQATLAFENRYRHRDGSYRTLEWSAQAEREQGRIFAVARDVTARKQAEAELARVNRALLARGLCDQALLRATEQEPFLQEVCRILVEQGGYRLAWVGFAEHDAARTVRPVACAGVEEGYLATIRTTWADEPRGRGPTGTSIRTGQPVIIRDIETDPRMEPWREVARQRGYRGSTALPLLHAGQVLGALHAYAAATDAFDEREVALLVALANDLAFGITTLRERAARALAEAALRRQQELQRAILENIPDPAWIKDEEGRFLAVNRAWCQFTGISAEAAVNHRDTEVFPPEVVASFRAEEEKVMASAQPTSEEEAVPDTAGKVHWFDTFRVGLSLAEVGVKGTLGIARDITRRRQTEEQLRQRLGYERGLRQVSLLLQEMGQFERTLGGVLEVLLNVSGMDRVYVFTARQDPARGWCVSQLAEHVREGIPSQLHNPDMQDAPLNAVTPDGWLERQFLQRRPCRGPLADLPAAFRQVLEAQGIRDFLILPVFAGNEFWGFLGFDDCTGVGRLDDDDVALLQNTADLIGWHVAATRDAEALRESELRQSLALQASEMGVWDWNVAVGRTYWSGQHEALWGYAPGEFDGTVAAFEARVHPEDLAGLRAAGQRAIAERAAFRHEFRVVWPDGSEHWICDYGRPSFDEAGQVVRMLGVVFEITQRKLSELALEQRVRERTAEALELYHQAPCGYHSVGPDGLILEMNDTELGWLGYARDEVVGQRRLLDLFTPASAAQWEPMMRELRATGEFGNWEGELRCRDGSTVILLAQVRMVRDAEGRFLRTRAAVLNVTERRRLERTLADSEARFRALFEKSRDAIITTDTTGRALDCNQAAVAMFRLADKADLLQRGPLALSLPEQPGGQPAGPAFGAAVAQAMATGSHVLEWWHQRPDGSVFPAEISISAVQVPGQMLLQGVITDISERKAAEAALRESEAKFRHLLAAAPVPMVLLDPQGGLSFLNEQFTRVFGYTAAELPDVDTWWRLAFPDAAQRAVTQAVWNVSLTEAQARGDEVLNFPGEYVVTCRDGQCRTTLVSGRLLPDQTLVVLQDITALKQATETLRQLSQAVQYSPSMIQIADAQGRVEYVNPAWEQVTGYRLEELKGKPPKPIKSGFHPPEFYRGLWNTIRAGDIWRGEFCNRRRNGELYWESAAIAPVRDEAGVIRHFVAVKEDITERRQAAADLLRAKEAAEAANRAKGTFLANMSHEIRTPMNAILGFAQLMQRDPLLTAEQQQRLATINRSGEHLLRLISDVLDMAKIESGRVGLALSDCDFHALVADVEDLFRLRLQEKGLSLVVQQAGDLPRHLHTDAGRVRQVLLNLLGNAFKFTERGGIELRLSATPMPATPVSGAATRVCVEVTDTGLGIAPEEMAGVFSAFEQTHSGRKYGGSGLGLAISRQLARKLGGDLTVVSRAGHGSTFTFTFVAELRDAPGGLPLTANPARRITRLRPGTPPPKILVVDDTETSRRLLRELLEMVGFVVEEATDGARAVTQCEANPPALVLMDRRMPALDGLTATRIIRERAGLQGVRILVVSADALGDTGDDWQKAGADGFITKPFRNEELLGQIGALLGIEYDYASPATTAAPLELAPAAIAALPAELRTALIRATETGSGNRLRELIAEQVLPVQPELGRVLGQLAARYEYPVILKALQTPSL